MLINIWELYVKPEFENQFEMLNGLSGGWYKFFSRSPDFFGTNCLKGVELVLKNDEIARKYLTQDRWKSQEGFERYVRANQNRFNELSEMNNGLVIDKNYVGFFGLGR